MNPLKQPILFPLLFLVFALLLAGCIETENKNGLLGEGLSIGDNTPGYHNECQGASCALVWGEGPDQCQYDEDCWEQPCGGEDPDNDCRHAACINNACILVSPEGPDQCQNNADCNITHLECENQACVPIQGAGQNQCATNADCVTHLACSNQQCQAIQGPGQNECATNNDCNANPGCNLTPFDLSATWGAFLDSAQNQDEFGAVVPLVPKGNSWEGCYYYQLNANSPKVLIHPEQQMSIDDGDARMDVSHYQVKDLVGYLHGEASYTYVIRFNTSIPTNLDFSNGGHAVIPFMGGRYKVIDINSEPPVFGVKLKNLARPTEIFWVYGDHFPTGTTGWGAGFTFDNNRQDWIFLTLANIEKQWDFLNPLYPPNNFNNRQPNSADFLDGTNFSKEGFAKTWFDGFQNDETRTPVDFLKGTNVAEGTGGPNMPSSYGAIHFTDAGEIEHYVPMAIILSAIDDCETGGHFTFDGIDHAYCVDSWDNPDPTWFALKQNSSGPVVNPDFNIPLSINNTDYNYSHTLTLLGKNNRQYKYFAHRTVSWGPPGIYLVLAGYSSVDPTHFTGYIDTLNQEAGELFLLGTITNDAYFTQFPQPEKAHFGSNTQPPQFPGVARPVYYPGIWLYDGNTSGSTTGIYRTAVFRLSENASHPPDGQMPGDDLHDTFEIYIDTDEGNSGTIDTAVIGEGTKPNWSGPTTAIWYANNNQNLTSLSEYLALPGQNSGNYKNVYTDNGSRIELEERELSVKMPGKQTVSLPENSFVEVKVKPEFDPNPNNRYQIWFEKGNKVGVTHVLRASLVKNGEIIVTIDNATAHSAIIFRWYGEEILAEDVYLEGILFPPYRFTVTFTAFPRVFMRMNIKETGLSPLIKPVPVP